MIAIECLTAPMCSVGESPLWSAAESSLYWVDIPAKRIHRLQVESGRLDAWVASEMVACIAHNAGGGFIAGMETGIFLLQLSADASVASTPFARVAHALPSMRFNDGRCDRQGRFWSGTMHTSMAAAQPAGALYRYDAITGISPPVVSKLLTQNGLAWSPDGAIMYLSDSHPHSQLIWQFDYDIASGTPRNRRLFVDMNQFSGRPDGAAVDIDGCYWTCANDAGQLLRFTPSGRLDRSITLPVLKPSMCAFGGTNFDTLFVTSIRPTPETTATQAMAGAVFALRPGVQGMTEIAFGQLA